MLKKYLILTAIIFHAGILYSQYDGDLIKKGNEYYDKKIYDKAFYYYNKALTSDPDNVDLYARIGLTASELKKYEDSIDSFDKAINLQNILGKEIPFWWFINNGYSYHYLKKYDKAVGYFLLVYNGKYDLKIRNDTLFPIAHLYFLINNYDLFFKFASACLKIEKDKGKIDILNDLLANAHFKLNNIEEALTYAEKCGKDFWIYKIYSPKIITFTCSFDLTKLVHFKPGIFYIPLPVDTDYQELISAQSNPQYKKIIKQNGETYAVYDFNAGFPKHFTLEFIIKKRIIRQTPANLQEYNDYNTEIGFFANPKVYEHNSILYDYDHPLLKSTFSEIHAIDRPKIEQVEAITNFLREKIPHVKMKFDIKTEYGKKMINYYSDIIKKVSEVLTYKTGHCVHRPNTCTALLRLLHIPARTILGFSCNIAESFTGYESDGHGLVEVYDSGSKKWIQAAIDGNKIWCNSWEHVIWYRETSTKPENYIPIYIGYYLNLLDGKVKWNAQYVTSGK